LFLDLPFQVPMIETRARPFEYPEERPLVAGHLGLTDIAHRSEGGHTMKVILDNVHYDLGIFTPRCGERIVTSNGPMHDNVSVSGDRASTEHHDCSSDTMSPQWRELYEIADDVILPALGSPDLNRALEKLLELVEEIADNAEAEGRHQRAGPGRD
jgi:hypothetical protein